MFVCFRHAGLTCDDVNECSTNNGCSPIEHSTCENIFGSYTCGCSDGFILDLESPDFSCTNENECNNGICSENAVCIDSDGSFECECNSGWLLFDGSQCLDNDECDDTAPDFADDFCTGDNERCSNEPGGRSCVCIGGYGRNATGFCHEIPNLTCDDQAQANCSCSVGYRGDPVYPGIHLDSCLDIDECAEGSFDCKNPQFPRCHNTAGAYLCLSVVTLMPSSSMPTASPTRVPSYTPTVSSPSSAPTLPPTGFPLSSSPTAAPTTNPTSSPTSLPTLPPSSNPTSQPTQAPTTGLPTGSPTGMPTFIILASSNDAEAGGAVSLSTAMIVMLSLLLAVIVVHQVKKARTGKSSSGEASLLPLPTRHSALPYVNSDLDLTISALPDYVSPDYVSHRNGLTVSPSVLSAISTSSIPLSPRLFSSTGRNLGSPAPEPSDDPDINPARFNSSRAGRSLGSPVASAAGDNIDPRLPSPSVLSGLYTPQASDFTYQIFDAIPTNHLKMGSQDPIFAPYNRYRNILPNPGSHVKLTSTAGMGSKKDPGSFPYINANFIQGWDQEPQVYIASQGPKTIGIPQFWRMIWQEEVSVVVMLTSLTENKGGQIRDKCAQYWSLDVGGTAKYAKFDVTTVSQHRNAGGYLKTVLRVASKKESRTVTHFWYDTWPDLGVPKEDAAQLVDLIVDSNRSKAQQNTPMVVHCSAGIGRTGVFVALDRVLNALQAGKRVDLIAQIISMRKDRGGMVQTHEQAQFVASLLEKISPPPSAPPAPLTAPRPGRPPKNASSSNTHASFANHLANPTGYSSDATTQDEAAVAEYGKPVFSVAGASTGASTTDADEAAVPYDGTDSENDEPADALTSARPAPDGSVEVTLTRFPSGTLAAEDGTRFDPFRSNTGTLDEDGGGSRESRASIESAGLDDDDYDNEDPRLTNSSPASSPGSLDAGSRPRSSSFNIDATQSQGKTGMSGVVRIEAVNLYDRDSWLHQPPAKTTTTFDKLVARNTTSEDGVFIIERHPQFDDKFVLNVTFQGRPTRHLMEKNNDGHFTINRRQYGDFSTIEDLVRALSDANTLPQGWPVRLANLVIPDAEVELLDSDNADGGDVTIVAAARPRSPSLAADADGLFPAELIDFSIPSEWQNGLTSGKEAAVAELMRFKKPETEKIADGICFFEKHAEAGKTVMNVTFKGRPTRHLIEQNGDGIFTVNRKAFGDHVALEGLLRALSMDPLPGGWPVRLAKVVLLAAEM